MDLGRRIKMYCGENKASSYLAQRLSVAVQQGNTTLVRGTISVDLFSFMSFLLFIIILICT